MKTHSELSAEALPTQHNGDEVLARLEKLRNTQIEIQNALVELSIEAGLSDEAFLDKYIAIIRGSSEQVFIGHMEAMLAIRDTLQPGIDIFDYNNTIERIMPVPEGYEGQSVARPYLYPISEEFSYPAARVAFVWRVLTDKTPEGVFVTLGTKIGALEIAGATTGADTADIQ